MKGAVFLLSIGLLIGLEARSQTTLDVFSGGSGDGSASLKISQPTFLSGPAPASLDFKGGNGDGSASIISVLSTLGGANSSFSYSGGVGDGSASVAVGTATLAGTVLSSFNFTGGSGDGVASVKSSSLFLDGSNFNTNVAINYTGGSGDGSSSNTITGIALNGIIPTFTFAGGNGDGTSSLFSNVVYLNGTIPVLDFKGGNGRGDASRKTNTLLLSGTASLARIAQNPIYGLQATCRNHQVKLEWNTELPVEQFEIEQSEDGSEFSTLGYASGRKTLDGKYSFHTFQGNQSSNLFFRVRHKSGSASVSEVIRVDQSRGDIISLYPNPVKDILHLASGENEKIHSIKIVDLNGRLLYQSRLHGVGQTELNLGTLPSGLYRLLVETDSGLRKELKITKQ